MARGIRALVTPAMLRWARELAGCSLEEAGRFAGRDAAAVAAWESDGAGELPTVRQARKLARAYRVSFALFYLEGPTADLEYGAVPEFRRVDPELGGVRPQSRQLRWMVRQAQERQVFAVELLRDGDASPLGWVGSASLDDDPEAVGGLIRGALGVGYDEPGFGDKERVLDWWVERVERLGVFVSRYRPDGNMYWFVEPTEARGLSLCDRLAPYVVLNSRDAPAGRTFTLMHELAHLYYGRCGVDDLSAEGLMPVDGRVLERRCNQVAAAVLMPLGRFGRVWGDAGGNLRDRVGQVADVFGVSRLAAAVRARSGGVGFVSEREFDDVRVWLDREYDEFREARRAGGGGGCLRRCGY